MAGELPYPLSSGRNYVEGAYVGRNYSWGPAWKAALPRTQVLGYGVRDWTHAANQVIEVSNAILNPANNQNMSGLFQGIKIPSDPKTIFGFGVIVGVAGAIAFSLLRKR